LRLHPLETLAGLLARTGRFGDAVAAAREAVYTDPLRESPRGARIAVYMREGDQAEALRERKRHRLRLEAVLGLEPTARLRAPLLR
jgi:DNA-binding SARP family transcriptional activator